MRHLNYAGAKAAPAVGQTLGPDSFGGCWTVAEVVAHDPASGRARVGLVPATTEARQARILAHLGLAR